MELERTPDRLLNAAIASGHLDLQEMLQDAMGRTAERRRAERLASGQPDPLEQLLDGMGNQHRSSRSRDAGKFAGTLKKKRTEPRIQTGAAETSPSDALTGINENGTNSQVRPVGK